jgi:deazaflavin-dependent oxidoreductase (nitroreductase family)
MSGRTAAEWRRMNDPVIAEFRATGGRVAGRRWPVLLLTTTGARRGRPPTTPLTCRVDRARLVATASKGGSPAHPRWYRNLVAHPAVTIELGGETFRARAATAAEPERTRLYDRQAAQLPFFDAYRQRVAARELPVVVFERLG